MLSPGGNRPGSRKLGFFQHLAAVCQGKVRDFKKEIRILRDHLTTKRASLPIGYLNNPRHLSAYTSFYLPLHLPEMSWILDRISQIRPKEKLSPDSILDLGCGPGTATLSALLWLGKKNGSHAKAPQVHLVDSSRHAIALADELVRRNSSAEVHTHRFNLFASSDEKTKESKALKAQWIVVSHVLNEFGNGPRFRQKKLSLIRKWIREYARPDSLIFLIEPPLREPTLDLMWLRDRLAEDFEVVAPCPRGTKLCPVLRTHMGWCYVQPPRAEARAQGLADWDRDIEKALDISLTRPGFSYLVLRSGLATETEGLNPQQHGIFVTDATRTRGLLCKKNVIQPQNTQAPYRGAYIMLSSGAKPPKKP